MAKFRKIVKIVKRGEISKFGNVDMHVELECGHIAWRTYKHGERVIGRKALCYRCKK